MNIKKRIIEEAEEDYQKFSAKLIPNINNILGVRLPVLRKIAKEIYTNEDWQKFLQCQTYEYIEEIMLQGMVIGLIKNEPKKILGFVGDFISKIDNWSVCDSFCAGLKFVKNNKSLVWKFLQPYFLSDNEFEIRFAYVMAIFYFIDEEYIDQVLNLIDEFEDERYYARMAVSWAVSVCYVKFPEKTYKFLQKTHLDKWTFKKSIQKICESYKVSNYDKLKVKNILK